MSAFNVLMQDDNETAYKTQHTGKNLEQLLEVLDTEPGNIFHSKNHIETDRDFEKNYLSCKNFVRRSKYEIISAEEKLLIERCNAQLPN